jgi:hemolysin activation/secretion protein
MSINLKGFAPVSYHFVAVTCAAGLLIPANGQAQDAGALQRELQLQLQRSAPQTPVQPQRPVAPTPAKPDEQKQPVKGYKFQGNTLLTDEQLQEAVAQWTNTQIRFSELKDVTTAIRNLYAKNGRVAQANIPPQEIQDGVILISIIEGKLGAVIVLGWLETPLPRLAGYAGGVVTGFSVLLTLLIQASGVFVGQNAVDAWSIPGW